MKSANVCISFKRVFEQKLKKTAIQSINPGLGYSGMTAHWKLNMLQQSINFCVRWPIAKLKTPKLTILDILDREEKLYVHEHYHDLS